MSKYEVVIGIETHVQLATKSKLFCGCNNDSREAAPNTNVCPVCLGMPGALPVLNGGAVKLALKAGHALNAYEGVGEFHSKFDRKNYFYPDSPMNYQITQFDEPIIGKGYVEFPLNGETKRIGVTRAHLEADAGKLVHPAGKNYSLVDLNRAGTPLLEIVSEPDMRSAEEAKAYAQELYNLMRYAGVSDANLYYGNMRFDVNVSLRPAGAKEFGTRTESKNLNSFRAVAGVVEYEAKRQAEILDRGEKVVQETRGWDENKNQTFSQRSKEEAHDYRYFPEPDLPPLVIKKEMLEEAKSSMPRFMPNDIRRALDEAKIPSKEQEVLISDKVATQLWMRINREHPNQAVFALNWLLGDRIKLEEETGKTLKNAGVQEASIALAGQMFASKKISSTNAKLLLRSLWIEGIGMSINDVHTADVDVGASTKDPVAYEELILQFAKERGYLQVSDTAALEKIVDQVIADNPGPVEQFKAGEEKVIGFLVGQVMKASKGQANPPMVNDILRAKLKG